MVSPPALDNYWRMTMHFLYLFLLGLFVTPTFADIGESQPQARLAVTLQRVTDKPRLPRSVPLRLTVENIGETSAAIVRLRSQNLERHAGWYGWNIKIDGPNGQWYFVPVPIPVAPLSDSDIIDLLPGEAFSLLIDVGQAATRKQPFTNADPNAWLFETNGEYTITVSYAPTKQWLSHVKREDVSLQPVQSNSVKLIIGRQTPHK